MVHLELETIVHRDLASRNILVRISKLILQLQLSAQMDAIVSDFGFARTLSNADDIGNEIKTL
jgi:hypothetical protein